jgi:glycerol-3-phosphate acyltransferase PlsY
VETEKIIFYVFCYLIGSIPFGLIIVKLSGKGDISKQGSGNIGATNVTRVAGRKIGVFVLLLDFAKGFLTVTLALEYFPGDTLLSLAAGLISVIGHIFSVFMGFKGGKGVATGLGTVFAVNYIAGFITIAIWISGFLLSRISAVGALAGFGLLPFIFFFAGDSSEEILIYSFLLSVIILLTHAKNIKRLLSGKENKF